LRDADQRATMQALLDRGVSTRRGVMNAHLEGTYQDRGCSLQGSGLDHSVAAQTGAIILPLAVQMTDDEIDFVADALRDVLEQARVAA
jgi:dTDP-4-amino-4,6-dideoxygalactose transaminase